MRVSLAQLNEDHCHRADGLLNLLRSDWLLAGSNASILVLMHKNSEEIDFALDMG